MADVERKPREPRYCYSVALYIESDLTAEEVNKQLASLQSINRVDIHDIDDAILIHDRRPDRRKRTK